MTPRTVDPVAEPDAPVVSRAAGREGRPGRARRDPPAHPDPQDLRGSPGHRDRRERP